MKRKITVYLKDMADYSASEVCFAINQLRGVEGAVVGRSDIDYKSEMLKAQDARDSAICRVHKLAFAEAIFKAAKERVAFIMRNRERLIEAWVAETGLLPSESMLVERSLPNGDMEVFVTKLDNKPNSKDV